MLESEISGPEWAVFRKQVRIIYKVSYAGQKANEGLWNRDWDSTCYFEQWNWLI